MRTRARTLLLAALAGSPGGALPAAGVDFARDVRPVLSRSCFRCHGPEEQRGGLRLDVRSRAFEGGLSGAAFLPGKGAESLLVQYVAGGGEQVMPPSGERLSPAEVEMLRAWIDEGASWPRGPEPPDAANPGRWGFRAPVRPGLPEVARPEWCRNPIDRFILERLERAGLEPSPEAGRRTLIRRMSLDLLGLPPSTEEVEEFEGEGRPDAVERLTDRLLASPRYGERWGRHWLDVARFAESTGFETNTIRENAWPYRDYVIRAFNEDRPYPRFILEQLAGDAVGEDAATGFIVGGPNDAVKSPEVRLTLEQRAGELHDMVSTVGSAFLGLTVGCARCHNHKFDPIPQRDYYALAAVFAGVEHGERDLPWPDQAERDRKASALRREIAELEASLAGRQPLADPAPPPGPGARRRPPVHPLGNIDRFAPVEARWVRFTVRATNDLEPCIDELEVYTAGPGGRNVALASEGARAAASSEYPNAAIHKIEHLNDGRFGNGRSWISNESGKGWAQLELNGVHRIDRVLWARDREGKYADRLAVEYRIEVAREPGEFKLVASSADRREFRPGAMPEPADPALARLRERLLELTRRKRIYAGSLREPPPTSRLHRGDPMEKREEVAPGAIGALGRPLGLSPGAPERERRLALARWLGSPENPLTARVMVNRVWHYHFGAGLADTPSDFGAMGGRPSHPELLDWLAVEFMESGWSVKALHRLILVSSAYRQDSGATPRGLAADAGARLLWRFPPRRLEAEAIRDSILWTSGKLDLSMGGPGFDVFEPNDNYVRVYKPREKFGPTEWRRMVYQRKPRKEQDGTFGAFDCPDAAQPAPRRLVSTNAVQALNLLNSPFVIEQAGFLAARLATEAPGGGPAELARLAFRRALGREPDLEESRAAARLVEEHGPAALCRALFNASEFVYLE